MERYFYGDTIADFIQKDENLILGILASCLTKQFTLEGTQAVAWQKQIQLLKMTLTPYIGRGRIFFEYSIPRMGRRIDTVVLIDGVVFILEFKVFNKAYLQADLNQVWDYALDLKHFHEASHSRLIVPILIATRAPNRKVVFEVFKDNIIKPLLANYKNLSEVITKTLEEFPSQRSNNCIDDLLWSISRYSPTPTIIEAACALYKNHNVADLSRNDAGAQNLTKTCSFIESVIKEAKENQFKAICFVTGVPGAGKTLVGLNTATKQAEIFKNNAVYLSGNGPLVDVLVEALARDKDTGSKTTKSQAIQAVKKFIQKVHHYRDACLEGTQIKGNDIVPIPGYFLTEENLTKSFAPNEHIAIFDEAQRAWDKKQLAKFMKSKKNRPNFPFSEPAYLISCLNRHNDWAVIVCLVGEGQEIHTGEAGISEWVSAVNDHFSHWHLYVSDHFVEQFDPNDQTTTELLAKSQYMTTEKSLHLNVSMRSFRAENLSHFVHHLLELDVEKAKIAYQNLKDYPIVLTRSIETAKNWLKQNAGGHERYGMIVSSQAHRLKPLAIDVRFKPNVVHWFLADNVKKADIRSSCFLEDVGTEFDVQGLELDWTCVVWDGDFRIKEKNSTLSWGHYSFKSGKWSNVLKSERKKYQKNAYRVLLTRARQGMVLVVPEGNEEDPTRNPEFYDLTFKYLKSLGIKEI